MAKIVIGEYEGSVYPEDGGWTVALSLGNNPNGSRKRLKRKGRTKTAAVKKAKQAVQDLERGVKPQPYYTVEECIIDFLAHGLKKCKAENSHLTYAGIARNYIIPRIGGVKLKDLTIDEVDKWLEKLALEFSTETVSRAHNLLKRAIRMAQRREKVGRNVAELADTPSGQTGRPSKSFTLENALRLIEVALDPQWEMGSYVILCLLTGIRTEEARSLTWADIDLENKVVYVLRADRDGGDTKTAKSRRGFTIAEIAATVLASHKTRQAAKRLATGELWQDNNLVFCMEDGTPYTAQQVRYRFKKITKAAGLGKNWAPRELRHTFVSLLSNHAEVAIEKIANLVGHSSTLITETVYRKELRPVIADGAQAMDKIIQFKSA
ncbi:tyrosine-type recombinase/integrase [Nonomuraea sp. B12E4]|uniref:tyrosine-type recombinase/integrase n=1 Tax=Nonomuraea sp. B12E4 TaxID=3153564 RepID=UPI00325E15D8